MTTTEMIFKDMREKWEMDLSPIFEAWLLIDGKPVSWVKLMDSLFTAGWLTICDIETREGYEGNGYASKLLSMVQKKTGRPSALTGGFTPEGFKCLNGKFPILPGYTDYGRATFSSMRFVRDWEEMRGPGR